MRVRNGRYECDQCGSELEMPLMKRPEIKLHGAGGQPNVRVLYLEGREIHRCQIDGFVHAQSE
jgi:hypothetical protein